jgi:natural resistance-associated macrophage protein 2
MHAMKKSSRPLRHCCRYPKGARWLLWIIIEAAIVGADIQETVGCSLAILILSNGAVPLWAGCIIVSVSAFGLLLLDRSGFRWLEALFAAFIGVEAVAMGINFFAAPIPASAVARGVFVPKVRASDS